MEKKLGIGFPWVNLEESRAAELLARLRKESPDVYDGWELTVARYLRPRFYASHALIEVRIARGDVIRVRYLLDGDDAMLPLEGRSDPIHAANASEGLVLNAETVLDYLRFFVFFLRGSDGPFTLLEAELELLPSEGEPVTPELEELRSHIRPLRIGGQDGQGRFLVPATVAYDGTMWRTTLAVSTGGEVEMIDEKDPVALGTARVPQCPYLDAPAAEAPVAAEETTPVTAPPEEDATDEAAPVRPAQTAGAGGNRLGSRDHACRGIGTARRRGARAGGQYAAQALQFANPGRRSDRAARTLRERLASNHRHRIGHPVR